MKTRVFKRALSVLCVVSLLLSVCVVGFTGIASAATRTYSFSNAGQNYTADYEEGAELAAPISPNTAVGFLGWYDAEGNKHTTAGVETSLYARYNGAVQSFDDGKGYFDPNGKFGNKAEGNMTMVDDPLNPGKGNTVIRVNNEGCWAGIGFSVATNVSDGATVDGFKMQEGKRYVITFKVHITGVPDNAFYRLTLYGSASTGISVSGDKTGLGIESKFTSNTDGWTDVTLTTNAISKNVADNHPYLYMTSGSAFVATSGSCNKGYAYIDNFGVTELCESEVTFNDRGKITTKKYNVGDSLPAASTASFLGWYDETFTTRYTVAPAINTVLYARYNGTYATFEQLGVFDPNGKIGSNTSVAVVDDPLKKQGKVAYADLTGSDKLVSFAPTAAEGISIPTTLSAGEYRVKLSYYAKNLNDDGIVVEVRTGDTAAIGTDAGVKTAPLASAIITKKTTGWQVLEIKFTLDSAAAANDAVIILVQDSAVALGGEANDAVAQLYMDNIDIKPYFEPTVIDSFTMDFEDNFEWVIDGETMEYTTSNGNGYVNRGEKITDSKGNHYFQMKHFLNKNGNFWFTINDGQEQFKLSPGGIYTIEFDYFVEHSETPTKIGVLATRGTKATTGLKMHALGFVDEFNARDDSGWSHAKLTFHTDTFDCKDYTSLGIYLYNSTAVPEEFCSVVNFDNIVVSTLSVSGEDGLVMFNDMGADYAIDPIVVEGGYSLSAIPTSVKFGYNFKGWEYVDDNGATQTLTKSTIIPCGIFNVSAKWELKKEAIELTFKSNASDFDAKSPVVAAIPGQKINKMPANPTATGQKFIGWYLDTGFTKPLNVNSAPNKSSIVYARWEVGNIIIDYEKYDNITHGAAKLSDRYSLKTFNGSRVLCYDLGAGSNKDPGGAARAMFYNGESYIPAYNGLDYTITLDYYIAKCKQPGQLQIYTSDPDNTWNNPIMQPGVTMYNDSLLGKWGKANFSFKANCSENGSPSKVLSLAVSGDAIIYFDNVVITCSENSMNHYGTAILLEGNGAKNVNTVSGEPGTPLNIPTPKRSNFLFTGWYTDAKCTTPYEGTVFPEGIIKLYAGWKLGKVAESFENFPSSVRALGVSGAYKFYNKDSLDFDASNIHTGSYSLFRNGDTTGDKSFTISRANDIALSIGSEYTLTMWVKPVEVTNPDCVISMSSIPNFVDIGNAEPIAEIAKVSDLKVGEWQQITYHFTAKNGYIALTTGHGVDMYIDDILVLLDGYTGTDTGDSSVSPVIILTLVVICAGVLIITSKKVFSK